MTLVAFREYIDGDSRECHINPSEVAMVREWKYHSFRPSITEIVLQSGEKVHVWDIIDIVNRRLFDEQPPQDQIFVWTCGCGTVNGVNLAVCRVCGRKEGET